MREVADSLARLSLRYDVHPELAVFSDHWPLTGSYTRSGSRASRRKSGSGRPRLRPLVGPLCVNRFVELMKERVSDNGDIANFTECVYSAHRDAVRELGGRPAVPCSVSDLAAATRVELDLAPDNISSVAICGRPR